MNRSEMREQAFILLYEKEFFKDKPCEEIEEIFAENISELSEYAKEAFENVCEHREELDEIISQIVDFFTAHKRLENRQTSKGKRFNPPSCNI